MRKAFFGRMLLAPDTGAGAGGTAPTPQTGGEPGTNAGGAAAGGASAPPASGEATKPDRTFTQAELDSIVKARLAEEQRRTQSKADADKRKADEEALAKQAEWQKLAEQRGAELEALRARGAAADAYEAKLNGLIESEIAAWPAEVKKLDPGAGNLEARLTWVENARDLAKKLASVPTAPNTEAGAGKQGQQPKPTPESTPTAPGGRYRFQQPGDVTW